MLRISDGHDGDCSVNRFRELVERRNKHTTVTMSSFSHTLKRSCVAFALRATRSPSVVRPLVSASLPFSSSAAVSSTTRSIHTTRLMATFSPGAPPGTNGTPVFNDIDFSIAKEASSESVIRNADTNAVFVVTGASRGLGLEFVKQLVDRTKV